MIDIMGGILLGVCAVVIVALCVGIAQAYSDFRKPAQPCTDYDEAPVHFNCRCNTGEAFTAEQMVYLSADGTVTGVANKVKPKIVVAYTKLELLVIYSDFEAADYHLCATFPTSRPLAARACAEALANASGLEVQEHRG